MKSEVKSQKLDKYNRSELLLSKADKKPDAGGNHENRTVLGGGETEVTLIHNSSFAGAQKVEAETDDSVPDEKDDKIGTLPHLAPGHKKKGKKKKETVEGKVETEIMPHHSVGVQHPKKKICWNARMHVGEKTTKTSDERAELETEDDSVGVGERINATTAHEPERC